MKRFILLLLPLMLLAAPVCMTAQTEHEDIEATLSTVTLSVTGRNVHIVSANGMSMEVFNLTGAKVATIRIDSADKTFALNLPKGCYLLKVGKVVRKISIE